MEIKDKGKGERLEQGLSDEAKVIKDLRSRGYEIEKATFRQDVDNGIDAYIEDADGKKHSVQIKVRKRKDANDVIFEIYRNIAVREIGRDYLGESEITICRLYDGRIVMIPTKLMRDLTDEHMSERDIEPEIYEECQFTIFSAGGGESGRKFVGYFSPDICDEL